MLISTAMIPNFTAFLEVRGNDILTADLLPGVIWNLDKFCLLIKGRATADALNTDVKYGAPAAISWLWKNKQDKLQFTVDDGEETMKAVVVLQAK